MHTHNGSFLRNGPILENILGMLIVEVCPEIIEVDGKVTRFKVSAAPKVVQPGLMPWHVMRSYADFRQLGERLSGTTRRRAFSSGSDAVFPSRLRLGSLESRRKSLQAWLVDALRRVLGGENEGLGPMCEFLAVSEHASSALTFHHSSLAVDVD